MCSSCSPSTRVSSLPSAGETRDRRRHFVGPDAAVPDRPDQLGRMEQEVLLEPALLRGGLRRERCEAAAAPLARQQQDDEQERDARERQQQPGLPRRRPLQCGLARAAPLELRPNDVALARGQAPAPEGLLPGAVHTPGRIDAQRDDDVLDVARAVGEGEVVVQGVAAARLHERAVERVGQVVDDLRAPRTEDRRGAGCASAARGPRTRRSGRGRRGFPRASRAARRSPGRCASCARSSTSWPGRRSNRRSPPFQSPVKTMCWRSTTCSTPCASSVAPTSSDFQCSSRAAAGEAERSAMQAPSGSRARTRRSLPHPCLLEVGEPLRSQGIGMTVV